MQILNVFQSNLNNNQSNKNQYNQIKNSLSRTAQIKKKQEDCMTWWAQHKNQLQQFFKNKINP